MKRITVLEIGEDEKDVQSAVDTYENFNMYVNEVVEQIKESKELDFVLIHRLSEHSDMALVKYYNLSMKKVCKIYFIGE